MLTKAENDNATVTYTRFYNGAGDKGITSTTIDGVTSNVEALLADMPSVSKADLLVSYPRPDDFIAIAEKGLFVYDWADTHRIERDYTRKYEKVTAPATPVPLQKLPPLLQASARRIKFSFLFSEETSINIKDNFQPHEICVAT